MADFKKIKINNTTYNVKDEGAGRSLSVSGQDISLKDGANNVLSTVTLPGGGGGISKPVNNVQKIEVNIAAIIASDGTVKWKMGDGFVSTSIAYSDTVLLTSYGGSGKPKPIRSNGKKYFSINSGDPNLLRAYTGSYEFCANEIVSYANNSLTRDKFIFSIPVNRVSSADTNKSIHSSHYIPHLYMDTNHSADLVEVIQELQVIPVVYNNESAGTTIDTNCDFFYKLYFKPGSSSAFPFTYTPAADQTVGRGFVIMREPVYSFTDAEYPSIIGMTENDSYKLYEGYNTDAGTVKSGYGTIEVSNNKKFCEDNTGYRFIPMSIFD